MKQRDTRLILEDGTEYRGVGFGSAKTRIVELVFNTSMVGYQEILSDPSYTDQAVVMTYPLIGNYGMNEDDYETKIPTIAGLVVRDYNDCPSNFRSSETLNAVMERYEIAGITDVDTRSITRHIRTNGSMKAMITREGEKTLPLSSAAALLGKTALPGDVVSRVSTRDRYVLGNPETSKYHVVVVDCGIKHNILRMLVENQCCLTVVPYNTVGEEILARNPDGVFFSNGPGNPEDVSETVETIRGLIGKVPIFGICLGHQLISLAYGARTYKLKFGHRGGNHPVKNLSIGHIEMTSQNHSYAVEEASLAETPLTVTHVNLLDQTVEGVCCEKDFVRSVQYHPESAPGPQDSAYLFEEFLTMMDKWKGEH